MKPVELTCNYLSNPLGVETPQPRLSWVLESQSRNARQSAYQILVVENEEDLEEEMEALWDSGRMETDRSIHIRYDGKPLVSMQRCVWKVRVWDEAGDVSEWSETHSWEMGLLNPEDWHAQWIAGARIPSDPYGASFAAPMLRTSFDIGKKITEARVYVCGLGYYELEINGERVGDQVLAPAFTRYDRSACYQIFDVTAHLHGGDNAIAAMLGNGWYNCQTKEVWNFHEAPWRGQPKLLCQLRICFDDGSEQLVCTGSGWRVWNSGPVVFDSLRNGETNDARREIGGWSLAGFDDSGWEPAIVVPGPGGVMRSQQMTPIRVTATLKPVSVKKNREGVWVFDLGQNISGWIRLHVEGAPGTEVTMRYGEKLSEDGGVDQSNIDVFIKSGDTQTDRYILSGAGSETWEPRFTYHGFQYVEISGFPGEPILASVEGRVVHTDFAARGGFTSSNELLNKIQNAARWSTLGNYHGIPTDCPQREKNGWTGDAQVSAEQVLLNFDPMTAYHKWMADFRDVQRPSGQLPGIVPTGGWGFLWGCGPAWDIAAVLIPWYLYVYCGDVTILEDQYDSIKSYIDFLATMAVDSIVGFGLGDWCPPEGGPDDHKCPTAVTDTAYYYVGASVLSKIAFLLGRNSDGERYGLIAEKIRDAFRDKFVRGANGEVEGNSQTSLACALYQGMINDDEIPAILRSLEAAVEQTDRHIDCGILGTKYLLHTLTEYGRADLAYDIATQEDFPSWGYWLKQGATTLWERWKGDPSRNHHMYSDVSAWFYKGLAGINPDPGCSGFKHIIFKPNPVSELRFAKAWHRSLYGRIECGWAQNEEGLELKVVVPPNTRATISFPTDDPGAVTADGSPLRDATDVEITGIRGGRLTAGVGSGSYSFTVGRES